MNKVNHVLIVLVVWTAYITISILFFLGSLNVIEEVSLLYRDAPLAGIHGFAEFLTGFAIGGMIMIVLGGGSFFFMSFLNQKPSFKHLIYTTMWLQKEDVNPTDLSGICFRQADDHFLIYAHRPDKSLVRIMRWLSLFLIAGLGMAWLKDQLLDPVGGMFTFWILCVVGIWIYYEFRPVKAVIFDRMKGTVTLPGPGILPDRTITFSHIIPGISFGKLVFKYSRFLNSGVSVWYEYNLDIWSFYVHYMDKNRPLPPGTAFDPYREKDFMRRKSENFPTPMYPNKCWLTDASTGYIYGSAHLKKRISHFKINYRSAYDTLLLHIKYASKNMAVTNYNDIVWIGIYENSYVFKLFAPEHDEILIFRHLSHLSDCYLVDGFVKKKSLICQRNPMNRYYLSIRHIQVAPLLLLIIILPESCIRELLYTIYR